MRLAAFRTFLLTTIFAAALSVPLAAHAQDYTDIWWAPCTQGASCDPTGHESGWGVNFVQNQSIIFATFYIYDINKNPTWYSAAMTDTGSGTSFAGPLYQTNGSFFGVPWNPADHPAATLAGSATFTPSTAVTTASTTGTLSYTVTNLPGGAIVVNKAIQRFAFQTIVLGGNYAGIMSTTYSNCTNNATNGTRLYDIDPQVTQTSDGQLQILVSFTGSSDSCTLSGQAVQLGQLFTVPSASYTCTLGANTTATVYEVKATPLGIEGRWVAPKVGDGAGGTCQQDASFSALLQ